MAGMKTVFSGQYGGWDPNPESEILNLLKMVYKEQNGVEGIVQVDHAGLECSVILGKYPGMDVVSLGPTLRSPHTAKERELVEVGFERRVVGDPGANNLVHLLLQTTHLRE